ncbi:helix-turn-helix domain-containing protein, partial [Mycoplasmopsis bovis]
MTAHGFQDKTYLTVSISTVSRFYNGGYVSKQTKSRIQDIVTKYNYYPN